MSIPSVPSTPADSHGAAILGDTATAQSTVPAEAAHLVGVEGAPGAPAPQAQGLNLPLFDTMTDATFDRVMSTSQSVPVVIFLWSGRSLESKGAIDMMQAITRDYAGRFQLVTADVEQVPQLVQALQAQSVPMAVALVAGRPVPLFQGVPAADQVRAIIDQLLEAAVQMGVTGVIAVSQEDVQEPVPEEYQAAYQAEDNGDVDAAIAQWKKIIELNPRDEKAKVELARVRFQQRTLAEPAESDDPFTQADHLFARGHSAEAFDVLLGVLEQGNAEDKERARMQLVDLFRVSGSDPAVKAARMRMTTLLMI